MLYVYKSMIDCILMWYICENILCWIFKVRREKNLFIYIEKKEDI